MKKIRTWFRKPVVTIAALLAAAVADRDERKADALEIAETVVRDVPAQRAVAHLVVLVPLFPPLRRREGAKRREITALAAAELLHLAQRAVDLRTLHASLLCHFFFAQMLLYICTGSQAIKKQPTAITA